jgi:hypothetical protein
MNLPTHPQPGGDEPVTAGPRRRTVVIATCVVIALASLHFLRTTLG